MTREEFETRYSVGDDYAIPYDDQVWSKDPIERDGWARDFLLSNKIKPKTVVSLKRRYAGLSKPIAMVISNFDWKSAKTI